MILKNIPESRIPIVGFLKNEQRTRPLAILVKYYISDFFKEQETFSPLTCNSQAIRSCHNSAKCRRLLILNCAKAIFL